MLNLNCNLFTFRFLSVSQQTASTPNVTASRASSLASSSYYHTHTFLSNHFYRAMFSLSFSSASLNSIDAERERVARVFTGLVVIIGREAPFTALEFVLLCGT
jgi:hypothetical protein